MQWDVYWENFVKDLTTKKIDTADRYRRLVIGVILGIMKLLNQWRTESSEVSGFMMLLTLYLRMTPTLPNLTLLSPLS